MSRTSHRFAAVVGMCALLFATLSVAAYACPKGLDTMESAMSAMPDGCPDQDTEQPNLCKAHCTAGQQQTTQAAADLPPLPLVHGLLATLFSAASAMPPSPRDAVDTTSSRTTDPPIAIRNCCFRL